MTAVTPSLCVSLKNEEYVYRCMITAICAMITSTGGLVEGLSQEDFFNGRSMPRNRELMRVFKDVELVEELGSGMQRILEAYDRSVFEISSGFIVVTFPYASDFERDVSEADDSLHRASEHDGEHDKRVGKILSFCETPKTRAEIQEFIGIASRVFFSKHLLQPLLDSGEIKMTIPDKPKSGNQKYVRA